MEWLLTIVKVYWPQMVHNLQHIYTIRGGQKYKIQKFDTCPMNSHFIGLGLLRTIFEIDIACREGPAPAFCCIAGI